MLYARLARMSSKVLPPADSAKGYLFFSFLAPYKPPHITWTPEDRAEISAMGPERVDYMPNDMRLTLIKMCRQLRNSTYIASLMPLLKSATLGSLPRRRVARLLRQHFLITPFDVSSCSMEAEFSAPGAPRLQPWIRTVQLSLQFDNLVPAEWLVRGTPRTIELPYLSSVRWDSAWEAHGHRPPWRRGQHEPNGTTTATATSASDATTAPGERSPRGLLVCFTGSLRGGPNSIKLREALVLACAKVPNGVCSSVVAETFPIRAPNDPTSEVERTTLRRALRLKRRATFCLEPTGYSPPRKSTIDAWLSGCIPVLFYQPAQYRQFLPWYVGPWAERASVRISPQAVISGSVDVIRLLNAIPHEAVRRMQETIAAHAHVLVYGVGERGVADDAVDRLLQVLKDEAVPQLARD